MNYCRRPRLVLASFLGTALICGVAVAAPNTGDFGTDHGHFTQQAQVGAKTKGTVDCGRAAEADLIKDRQKSAIWKPSEEIQQLIGTRMPEFADDLKWVNSPPLKLSQLKGHPVFVRFWYRNCPMCTASAPEMNELYDDFAKRGLVVIGIHHSKTTKGDTVDEVKDAVATSGFKFPVAIDNSWNTVQRIWIHAKAREYSSASFLVDQNGVIVWGHDLGRLEKGTPAVASLHAAVRKLLDKQPAVAAKTDDEHP